jgi:hypothetical protein
MFNENKDENSKVLYFWALKEQQEILNELSKFEISDFYQILTPQYQHVSLNKKSIQLKRINVMMMSHVR